MNKIYTISVIKIFPKNKWEKINLLRTLKSTFYNFIFYRSFRRALDHYNYFRNYTKIESMFSTRFIGFFLNKEDAIKHVSNNSTNMQESYYNFAAIEERFEGFSYLECIVNQIFYKFDKDEQIFKEIDKTEFEPFGILKDRKVLTVFSLN